MDRITDERFIGVRPGTLVSFELELSARGVSPPAGATVRAEALVTFYASGSWMGETTVLIVIEGDDGGGCF